MQTKKLILQLVTFHGVENRTAAMQLIPFFAEYFHAFQFLPYLLPALRPYLLVFSVQISYPVIVIERYELCHIIFIDFLLLFDTTPYNKLHLSC